VGATISRLSALPAGWLARRVGVTRPFRGARRRRSWGNEEEREPSGGATFWGLRRLTDWEIPEYAIRQLPFIPSKLNHHSMQLGFPLGVGWLWLPATVTPKE